MKEEQNPNSENSQETADRSMYNGSSSPYKGSRDDIGANSETTFAEREEQFVGEETLAEEMTGSENVSQRLQSFVQDKPLTLFGAAAGLGVAVGAGILLSRRSSISRRDKRRSVRMRQSFQKSMDTLADRLSQMSESLEETGEDVSAKTREKVSDAQTTGENLRQELSTKALDSIEQVRTEGERLLSDLSDKVRASDTKTVLALTCGTAAAAGLLARLLSDRPSSTRPYEERSKEELYEEAREQDIKGRSQMSKEELISALSH